MREMEPNGGLAAVETTSLAGHACAWDALAEARPVPSPFLLSWWLEAMAAAGDSRYVLVLDGERLVGGLAVERDRWAGLRRVRLLGDGPLAPDHLDLVAAPDRQDEVVDAITRWLRRQGPCLIDLRGVAQDALLCRLCPGPRLVTVLSSSPHLVLDPPEAPPVGPRRHRRDLRQQSRRVEREGARYRIVAGDDPDELDRALTDLRARHVERWGEQSGFARAFPTFERAARIGAARGAVRIHELVAGREVVANEVTLDAGSHRHRYQVGRTTEHRWRGAGNALLCAVIRNAQQDGCVEFDFLRGREPYKYDWTATERTILRVRSAVGIAPRLVLAGMRLAERGRPAARAVKAQIRRWRARTRRAPA